MQAKLQRQAVPVLAAGSLIRSTVYLIWRRCWGVRPGRGQRRFRR
jgi:hypothetical protein